MVHFAKFDNVTGRIQTGSCGLGDWSEQETSASECVVQTQREYLPDELFVDGEDFVLREYGTGEPVAIEPVTASWLAEALAPLRDTPRSLTEALDRIRGAHTRLEIQSIIAGLSA